jgi:pSer/pThr/pTyr-binding forkhead associated (FHA) protein
LLEPADKFCSNCGAVVPGAPAIAPAAEPAAVPAAPITAAGPRLVATASGAVFGPFDKPEVLIGRTDPDSGSFPEVDLTDHGGIDGGVSRRHARLLIEGGGYFLEDLNSTNGTFVNKQKLAVKTRQPIREGDEIRCGRVILQFHTGS